MEQYSRKDASFALCGLNCCLCPRFHTDGPSRCPGCGGPDFSLKHPTCAVVTCSKKHGSIEYCFECGEYPCRKYAVPGMADSFISYKNVIHDLSSARQNIKQYLIDLKKKHRYLLELLANFNDGRSKGFYCLAVNLLPLSELTVIMKKVKALGKALNTAIKEKAKTATALFEATARRLNIELVLRK
jgi:hypothetical protein